MNLCSHKHEEICYEGNDCPLCELKADLRKQEWQYEEQIKALELKVSDLEEEVTSAENEIRDLRGA